MPGKMSLVTVLAFAATSAAHAAGTPVALSNVTGDLSIYTNGVVYPTAGTTVTIGGANGPIDFTLAQFFANDPNSTEVGVAQADNVNPSLTEDFAPIAISGPTTFYSLINSADGSYGADVGNLTFTFEDGPAFVYDLVEGDNIRDHFDGQFNNLASGVYGTANFTNDFGTDRLDAQEIVLPTSYIGDSLVSVTINSTNPGSGSPFLAALSDTMTALPPVTTAVPEASTWAMMTLGFGLLGGTLRRRRETARLAFA